MSRAPAPGAFRCWLTEAGAGRPFEAGSARTLGAAQGLVDRPYRPGFAEVVDERTGRRWVRRRGSWFTAAPAERPARADRR